MALNAHAFVCACAMSRNQPLCFDFSSFLHRCYLVVRTQRGLCYNFSKHILQVCTAQLFKLTCNFIPVQVHTGLSSSRSHVNTSLEIDTLKDFMLRELLGHG